MISKTLYSDKRGLPVDCGGYVLQNDEYVIRVTEHSGSLDPDKYISLERNLWK